MTDVIAHRGASRLRPGEHGRGVRAGRRGRAPTASSWTSGGPPTVCSSCTTTPVSPTGGSIVDTPLAGPAGVRPDARRGPRRLRRGVGQHRDQERRARARLRSRRPRRRRGAGRAGRARAGRWLMSCFRLRDRRPLPAARPDHPDGVADVRDRSRHRRRARRPRATPRSTRGSRRVTADADRALPRRRHPRQRLDVQRSRRASSPSPPPASTASSPMSPDVDARRARPPPRFLTRVLPDQRAELASEAVGDAGIARRTASGTWGNSRRVGLAEVVAVELVGERRLVLDDDVVEVDLLVELVARLDAAAAQRAGERAPGSCEPASCGT